MMIMKVVYLIYHHLILKENDITHTIDLKKFGTGTLVDFYSFVWHRVNEVTKGVRKVLVGWTLGKQWS